MRRCRLLLLCLALTLQGWSPFAWAAQLCPMTLAMLTEIADAAEGGHAQPDCCHDLAGYLLTGQTCENARAMTAPAAGLPQAVRVPLPDGAASPPAWQHRPEAPARDPDRIWRPPALR